MKKIYQLIKEVFAKIFVALKRLFNLLFFPNKIVDKLAEEALTSPGKMILKKFFKSKTAVLGLITFILIFVSIFTLSAIYPISDSDQDVTQQHVIPGYHMRRVPKALNEPIQISSGAIASIGLNANGQTYVWGNNLKVINVNPEASDAYLAELAAAKKDAVKVSAGSTHFLIEGANGKLYSWGAKASAQIDGNNPLTRLYVLPDDLVNYTGGYKSIVAGQQVNAAVTNDGVLYAWGNLNMIGITLTQISQANQRGEIKKIDINTKNLIVLYEDGTMFSLGQVGSATSLITPVRTGIVDFALSLESGIAIRENGSIAVWGSSNNPQVSGMPTGITNPQKVTAGYTHFTVLTEDGSLISWGSDRYGQLKIDRRTARDEITDVFTGGYQIYSIDKNNDITSAGLSGYLLGTDELGRDLFRRLAQGGRVTLTVGAVAVLISTTIGVTIGGVSGFFGGRIDNILMRFTEIVNSIPFLPIAMTLSVLIGNSLTPSQRMYMIMVILGVLSWGGLARLVRAQVLAEREKDFVLAAKALGIRQRKIIFNHIIPNVISVIIVSVTLSYAGSLLIESSLSFLGFGVIPPTPTWGNMLTSAQSSAVISTYWWRWIFPSIAISMSTLSINFIGDGLRNAIDPKSSER